MATDIYKVIAYYKGGGQRKKKFYESTKMYEKYYEQERKYSEKYEGKVVGYKYVGDDWKIVNEDNYDLFSFTKINV